MIGETYRVGVARKSITPKLGIRLTGYAVREGVSRGVDEPLTLSVLAVRGGDTVVLLVAADLCLIDLEFAARLREHCAKAAEISAAHVLVNVSHTHCTPGIGRYVSGDTPEQLALQGIYWKRVLRAARDATRTALSNLQVARLSTGWGECRGNINRRQATGDQGVILGGNPAGVCDNSVGVLRFDALDGRPIAIVFRYSCHPVTLGPRTNRVSPDFVGPARDLVESALRCPALFLQGAAGNVNPNTGIGQDADDSPQVDEDKKRLGSALGGEVLKVAQGLRTHRRRAEPRLINSVAVYWLYEYEQIPIGPEGRVSVSEEFLELPLIPFPGLADVEMEREAWAARLREAREAGGGEWRVNPMLRFDHWAQVRLDAARNGPNPATVRFPIQAIRIGDVRIVALPFEVMSETGLTLRSALGADTFVLGYSNGIVTYLPTPEISAEGGMESKLGYKAYYLPAEIPGDWEPRIRRAVTEQFRNLP